MSRTRLVLHIGRQKTGTTSIQRFLAANADALAARGILYPATGRLDGRHTAHHELAVALNPKESDGTALGELRGRYRAELAASVHETVVLSSEAFQRIEDFSRLDTFLGDARLRVLCYVRDCLAAKQSSWAQGVHAAGQRSTFADFASGTRLHYARFADLWKGAVGEFDLALFERGRLRDGDVVADFLTRIGHAAFARDLEGLARDDGLPSLGGNLLHARHIMNVARAGAPDPHGTFEALSVLAAGEPRWRGRWYVVPSVRALIERVDRDDQRFLCERFGEVARGELDALPPMPDPDTLVGDMARILSDPILAQGFAAAGLGTPHSAPIDDARG